MNFKLNKKTIFSHRNLLLVGSATILAYSFFKLGDVRWGSLKLQSENYITVTGTASSAKKNEIASFNVSVMTMNEDKQVAVSETNAKISAVIDATKKFGIPTEDIKTTNMNVYQQEEPYFEDGVQKYRPQNWRASSTLELKLKDISKVDDLVALLTSLDTTDLYGPNYAVDDYNSSSNDLLSDALKDATSKAESLASSSGRSLGKVLRIVEGYDSYSPGPFMMDRAYGAGGGGGISSEPGTSDVQKTITVTFDLR